MPIIINLRGQGKSECRSCRDFHFGEPLSVVYEERLTSPFLVANRSRRSFVSLHTDLGSGPVEGIIRRGGCLRCRAFYFCRKKGQNRKYLQVIIIIINMQPFQQN